MGGAGDGVGPDRPGAAVDPIAGRAAAGRGHHTGPLFGIPATGRPLEVLEIGIWRIRDNLVAEAWFLGDELTLLRQLGMPVTSHILEALGATAEGRG